jgi:hypothetical protein
VTDDTTPERLSDTFNGDIIVCRAHTAGGKDNIKQARERDYLTGNDIDLIGNDRDPLDVHA